MYIPRVSANQQAENVAIGGERNDEDQAVPSVMELHEKLTDEEVDEMILETDVDDTQCSEQIVDVPVPQIVNMSRHTQSGGEHRQRFSVPRNKLRTHRMRRLSQGKTQQ